MKNKHIHLPHFKRSNLTIFKHRLSLFCTWDFRVLSLIAIVCIFFLIKYSFIILEKLDSADNEIYSFLVNLSSGFLTGYLVYLLGEKIPTYNKTIRNERMIYSVLDDYSRKFIQAFSLLLLFEDTSKLDYIKNIPEIRDFLNKDIVGDSQYSVNRFIVSDFKKNCKKQDKLIKEFSSLEDCWNKLYEIVRFIDTPVKTIVINLESNSWRDTLFLIEQKISQQLVQFDIITFAKDIILANLDLVRYRQQIK